MEEVRVLAEEGIELDVTSYHRKVEEAEEQRRQERQKREAILYLENLEREEKEAAAAQARARMMAARAAQMAHNAVKEEQETKPVTMAMNFAEKNVQKRNQQIITGFEAEFEKFACLGSSDIKPTLMPQPTPDTDSNNCLQSSYSKMKMNPPVKKSRRHPLSKPPMRSPLAIVKQEACSDEELTSPLGLEGNIKKEEDLWQRLSPNSPNQTEKTFNSAVSKLEPYCAICCLFCPYTQPPMLPGQQHVPTPGPGSHTRPLVPEMCFSAGAANTEPPPSNSFIGEDGTSVLLSCSSCHMQVHASCYGVRPDSVKGSWTCSRCEAGAWTMECCLCYLRGGALKRTVDKRWVHVICAIAVAEVRFLNAAERELVDVSAVPDKRKRLKCVYCYNSTNPIQGACIQCSLENCSTSFHVTCANIARVVMKPADWPYVVSVTCHKHKNSQKINMTHPPGKMTPQKSTKTKTPRGSVSGGGVAPVAPAGSKINKQTTPQRSKKTETPKKVAAAPVAPVPRLALKAPREPTLGQNVIGRWSNGWFYHCIIIGTATQTFYEVQFDDGSYIDNLQPENVTSHNCLHNGPPEVGEMIVVHTHDGKVLKASYIKTHLHQLYQVEFQDQTQGLLKPTEIFMLDQELPKRVRSRLVVQGTSEQPAASEDEAQAAKRPRMPSSSDLPATPAVPPAPVTTPPQSNCFQSSTPPGHSVTAPPQLQPAPTRLTQLQPAPTRLTQLQPAPPPLTQLQPLYPPDPTPAATMDFPAHPTSDTTMDVAPSGCPSMDGAVSHMATARCLTDALTESDPSLALAEALLQSPLNSSDPMNSEPILSVPMPLGPMPNDYTPSSGFVSYMETLLNSHFPQDNAPGPMY